MSAEKPLHQRVAEALGVLPRVDWHILTADSTATALALGSKCEADEYLAEQHARGRMLQYHVGSWERFPQYDTSWEVTGPLIERFHVSLSYDYWEGRTVTFPVDQSWAAEDERYNSCDEESDQSMYRGQGRTPLIAVCNLILALNAAGKLVSGAEPTPTEPEKGR